MLHQFIATGVILVAAIVLHGVATSAIRRRVKTRGLKPQSGLLARKMSTTFIILAAVLAIGLVWGVAPRNIWVSVASVVTLVAIGFFAVWCILSNVIAGFLILISQPFGVGDEVVFLPENIQGTVANITSMFVVLEDSEGTTVTIPNNFVFQRIVKRLKKADAD